ncbi:hypothetical protein FXF51_05845 [Nonomuraea sp. PA05]|uniref:hypothetical protein n=1 Tax=Nonomuraea sp. PA05 TaxID=2604466 RepID=UPI0011DA5A99|nr:hypothetical protein [Nonomuraea sp. PA05]TYB69682.1 hypothetical protein FXF51_05845 [Nonomuraea sp. PA05]
MTCIAFGHDDAQEALRQFLSGDDNGRWCTGRRIARYIARPDDRGLAAVIVDPGEYEDLQEAQAALNAMRQVLGRYPETDVGEPASPVPVPTLTEPEEARKP